MNNRFEPAPDAPGHSSIALSRPGDTELVNAISVDNVIFGLEQGRLKVLLVRQSDTRHRGLWALPGGWIRRNEDLRDAADRVLADLTGLHDIYLEQFRTFGRIDRFPHDRVITVAYYALVNTEQYPLVAGRATRGVEWYPVSDTPRLVYDHAEILSRAIDYLRNAIRHRPIGFELLPEKFTLGQLQAVYEAVLGRKLDKPNFRRKILRMRFVRPCDEFQTGARHRAAQLYSFDLVGYRANEFAQFP